MHDMTEGRTGPWMNTASGGRFYPHDPRPEEVRANDIANGLAMDCRYSGQGRTDRYYSVAEHCVHVARAFRRMYGDPLGTLAALFHDGAEGYLNDLGRPTKWGCPDYKLAEDKVQHAINEHFGLVDAAELWEKEIKEIDCRIVPMEKDFIFAVSQPWIYDQFKPLLNTTLWGLKPVQAKRVFAWEYGRICHALKITPEEIGK